jgi:aldehyde dehydrogenase (NAD+)
MEEIVKNLRESFKTNVTKSVEWRKSQLLAVERLIDENHAEICEALKKDLNKPDLETAIMEVGLIKNSITYCLKNMNTVMKLNKVTPHLKARALHSTYVQYQPRGVVLVIGAWKLINFHFFFLIKNIIKSTL